MMAIQRAQLTNYAQKIDKASQKIAELQKRYDQHQDISNQVQEILPILQECNQFLHDKQITHDPSLKSSINQLVSALQLFPFSAIEHDKSIQVKVNALQNSLFNQFFQQLQHLETNLRQWRIGKKVASTHGSKET